MTSDDTLKDLREKILDVVKHFKLTNKYGINPDLAVNDIMNLIHSAQQEAKIQGQLQALSFMHNAGHIGGEAYKKSVESIYKQKERPQIESESKNG